MAGLERHGSLLLGIHGFIGVRLERDMNRVGQIRTYTPYMTVYLVISGQKFRKCTVYIWFRPTLLMKSVTSVLTLCQLKVVRCLGRVSTDLKHGGGVLLSGANSPPFR